MGEITHFQFTYRVRPDETVTVGVHTFKGGQPPGFFSGTLVLAKREWWDFAEIMQSAYPKRVEFIRLEGPAAVEAKAG